MANMFITPAKLRKRIATIAAGIIVITGAGLGANFVIKNAAEEQMFILTGTGGNLSLSGSLSTGGSQFEVTSTGAIKPKVLIGYGVVCVDSGSMLGKCSNAIDAAGHCDCVVP